MVNDILFAHTYFDLQAWFAELLCCSAHKNVVNALLVHKHFPQEQFSEKKNSILSAIICNLIWKNPPYATFSEN